MQSSAFRLAELLAARAASGEAWHEFLRTDTLSMGVYVLEAGEADPQTPHSEDEVYYVVEGRGSLRVGEEDHPVQAGSVVWVAAQASHQFHDIRERLTALVFFAPPEYSQQ